MRQLRCHQCRSADLVLHETRFEHVEFDGGLFINEQNCIEARGNAIFTPGDIQPGLTRIECASCGHQWHPRRDFTGSKEAGGER